VVELDAHTGEHTKREESRGMQGNNSSTFYHRKTNNVKC
jgi:hypothetical protein